MWARPCGALLPVLSRLAGDGYRVQAAGRLESALSRNWSSRREAVRERARSASAAVPIDPAWMMLALVQSIPPDAVVVDEGLVTSRPLLDLYPFRDRDAYYGLASGGIGFAIAGAVGISLAHPERRVVAVIGDGSAMYGVQALWTAANLDLPITYVIANNRGYRILKERIVAYGGRESFTGMELRRAGDRFRRSGGEPRRSRTPGLGAGRDPRCDARGAGKVRTGAARRRGSGRVLNDARPGTTLDPAPIAKGRQTMLRPTILVVALLTGAASLHADLTRVDGAALEELLKQGVPVVDIRTPEEWQATGVIEGSHLLTFFDSQGRYDVPAWLVGLSEIAAPDEPVAIICHSGGRSAVVSRFLDSKVEYQRVHDAHEGIVRWIEEGRPTVKPAR